MPLGQLKKPIKSIHVMMSPAPFDNKDALLKEECMEIHILSHRTPIHHHAVVVNNTGIKCPNEIFYLVSFLIWKTCKPSA